MFFKVKTSEEVFEILKKFDPLGEEVLPLDACIGRIASQNIISPEDLPGFHRSTMDGYALRAKDTFGAGESLPALFDIKGEVVMGQIPDTGVGPGQAIKISTGGMLPDGADGVVMVEYCHSLDEETLEVSRAISPLENVIRPDDDFKKGTGVLSKGSRLRPQDLGLLAGLGMEEVRVYKRPRVAILSTGDEVIPIHKTPKPGQVRDINSYTLGAFCLQSGVTPMNMGLCGDDFDTMRNKVEKGLEEADSLWLSGGSSVGTRDMTLKVFESFKDTEVLVHGISISPGKPTIIARIGSCPVFGLPGHTASAMVVADVFLGPFLAHLSGEGGFPRKLYHEVEAKLSRNIESHSGREDYIRVRLAGEGEALVAEPIFGKSGLISTLVEADGLVRVDRNLEGLYQDQKVHVMVFDRDGWKENRP